MNKHAAVKLGLLSGIAALAFGLSSAGAADFAVSETIVEPAPVYQSQVITPAQGYYAAPRTYVSGGPYVAVDPVPVVAEPQVTYVAPAPFWTPPFMAPAPYVAQRSYVAPTTVVAEPLDIGPRQTVVRERVIRQRVAAPRTRLVRERIVREEIVTPRRTIATETVVAPRNPIVTTGYSTNRQCSTGLDGVERCY